jgi:MYXO-CTERM domain-containing protein
MLSRFRHVFGVIFVLLLASCSGGGCGGCGGCAGMTPLPGGFPTDKVAENAASVRVSRPGLDFIQKELGAIAAKAANATDGKMFFDIPESPFAASGISGTICPGGPDPSANPPRCRAVIDLAGSTFLIDSVTPNAINVEAKVPLQLNDTPVNASIITVHVGYGANAQCVGNNQQTVSVEPKVLPVKVSFPLVAETTAPRVGYTKVDIDAATIDLSGIAADDVGLCADCGILPSSVCQSALDAIKGTLVDQLRSTLDSQVKSLLREQLCTKPNPTLNPACPTNTIPDANNTYCVYETDNAKCVPVLLGTDGHMELGELLKSVSPATSGGIDLGLASFGPMKPAPGIAVNGDGRTPNGITLGMAGGVLPQPQSKCVVPKAVTPPTGIPIPDELNPTVADPSGTPHVGIALAGRFLDYSFTGIYNSGLLCLGVSTEQFDMLKSGLLSFLIPSLKTITFDQADAAAAIATRPQEPPIVKLGGGTNVNDDPLLLVTLPKFSLDFYIWSFDRFARVFTYTGDLTLPINLQTGKGSNNPTGGLVPAIGEIKVQNGKVTNADLLLLDDPGVVAGAVSGIFGSISKQLVGGGFSPIDLSSAVSSLGLNLEVDKITKLTKGSDEFVGIFATMSKKQGTALAEADTRAKLVAKRVWKDHMQASTYEREKLPELEVDLSSSLDDGTRTIEYSWWIDGGTRSPWEPAKHIVIKDDQLFLQGRHVLHVASRIAGEPQTEDATPADIPYVIDAIAPVVKVDRAGDGTATIKAWDIVSKAEALVARFRLDDGAYTEWRPVAELAPLKTGDAESVEVEVKDEEGNVGTVRQALRGRADPTIAGASSSCGCSTPGTKDSGGHVALVVAVLAGLALVVLRRRGLGGDTARRAVSRGGLALGAIGVVAATSQGCACGSEAEPQTGCGSDCNQPCLTGLQKGQPGAYLSVAKSKDGTLWAAGYNDALLAESDALLWGDLVVGKYDAGKHEVAWETVDGVPVHADGTCGSYEPYGWRKGETDSGDNVGRYTSIQISAKDQPMVSYYDDTNKRLKFAINDGGWKVSVLKEQPGADIGKYSKMLLVDNKPVIAYMHLESGNAGRTRTKLSLARAKVESPHGPADFSFEDIAVDEDGPCRATSCATGDACVKETGTCTKQVGGCQPACGEAEACVTKDGKSTCVAKMGGVETYPRGLGPYISFASGPGGLGLVAYDGYHGNLVGFMGRSVGRWDRVILDGETGKREDKTAIDTGDVGIAAALAIAPNGTWHVSYVNGSDESLRYITMTNGKPGESEIVDDGSGVDGKPHADGKHFVGDDSAIRVEGDVVTIYYADSSSLGLRRAVGTGASGSRKWDLRSVKQDNRWVAFPQFVPGENKVAAWWRQSTRATKTVEGNVTVISP